MKKKLLAVVLTAAMALGMVACGSASGDNGSAAGDGTQSGSASGDTVKIGIVLDVVLTMVPSTSLHGKAFREHSQSLASRLSIWSLPAMQIMQQTLRTLWMRTVI